MYGIQDIEAYKKNLRLRYQEEMKKSKKDSSENIHTHVSIPEAPNERESGAHHTPLDPLLEIESPLRGKRDDHPPEDDRVVKKLRVGNIEIDMPDKMVEPCSSSSISFAQSLSSLLCFPRDKIEVGSLPISDCYAQSMAHGTQTLLWMANSFDRAKFLEADYKRLEQEKKDVDAAKSKADKDLEDLKQVLQTTQDKVDALELRNQTLALAESVQDYVKNKPFGQRPISEKNLSGNYYVKVVEDTEARQKPWLEKWWTPTNDHKNERNEQNSSWDKLTVDRNLVLTACSSIKPCNTKLLILDVNGLLADFVSCEPDGYIADSKLGNTAVFIRPHCDDFLRFCFERFNVGIWSSRTERNVDSVLELLLGENKSKLVFCWDQSHCTLTGHNTLENQKKPLVLKELKKLWEKHEPNLPWNIGDYNESNTLLLDDSPYKSLKNPPNTGIFPDTYQYKNSKDDSLGPEGDLRSYLERLYLAPNIQKYVEQNPFGQRPITESNPRWSFYANIIGLNSVKREESSCHSDVRHASRENITDIEWLKKTVTEESVTEDIHSTQNFDEQSQLDKLQIDKNEKNSSWDKWDNLVITACSLIQPFENSRNICEGENAISDIHGYDPPTQPNEQNRQSRTEDLIHLLSNKDDGQDCSAGCDTVVTTREPSRLPWIPRSSLGRNREVFRKTKLLILDVNGLLADFVTKEPDGYVADSRLGDKAVFKRPYCDDFLNFCFENFHIGFWLTTSKKLAQSNLNFLLGRAAKNVLFSWDISNCTETGYSTVERRDRQIIFKELRRLWEKDEQYLSCGRGEFDQSNTLLVDNYPCTALLNPPHTAIFPRRYRYKDEKTDDSLGPEGDLRVFLEGLALAESVQDYVKNKPFGQRPISEKNLSWNYYVRVVEDTKARQKPWLEKWWTPTSDHKNERNEQNSRWDKLTVDRNLVLTACSSIKPCKTKLLILDVNGLLADFVSYEPDGYIADSKLGNTAVFKRPYCDDFLNFCFEKFRIGFWLTTSSKNARCNLDFLLGRAAKDVPFAWDISQCFDTGFNTLERRNRHILFKELRLVWEKNEWSSPWGREVFDQSNTLLVDNYPYTALLNPPHTGIFPPRYRYKDEQTDDSLGPGGDLREFLEGLVLAENVQDYVKNNPFGQPPISDEHPSWNYYVRVIEDSKARQKPWLEKWWTPTNDHKKTC